MHFYIAKLVGFRIYKSVILKMYICFLKRSERFFSNRNVVTRISFMPCTHRSRLLWNLHFFQECVDF